MTPRTMIGAGTVYSDKDTVKSVQRQLHALSVATGNAGFDPYSDKSKDDGLLSAATANAIIAFNFVYGWADDGPNITAGTLEALKRPDVKDPAGYAKQAAEAAAQATTPAEVQAAAAQTAKVAAGAPPEVKQEAQAAQKEAMAAKTPAQVVKARERVQRAAEGVKDAGGSNLLTRELFSGVRVWHLGVTLGGLAAVGVLTLLFGRRRGKDAGR